ncbi:hypothetical protein AVEN_22594-1 [Araneus ventricosus]|uniref:Uncharacterized protein n=1 Tax=Araneus ventricosus TaxID=182803 RepID=A0A4Y2E8B2_ARAVE|nr:hypothetical protein AVEN_22594-1 [Araneus ventricosus]
MQLTANGLARNGLIDQQHISEHVHEGWAYFFVDRNFYEPIIHDYYTPRKWCGGTLRHSTFQPIHLGRIIQGRKPISYRHSDALPLSKREPPPALISSRARDPFPTFLHRSHFSL